MGGRLPAAGSRPPAAVVGRAPAGALASACATVVLRDGLAVVCEVFAARALLRPLRLSRHALGLWLSFIGPVILLLIQSPLPQQTATTKRFLLMPFEVQKLSSANFALLPGVLSPFLHRSAHLALRLVLLEVEGHLAAHLALHPLIRRRGRLLRLRGDERRTGGPVARQKPRSVVGLAAAATSTGHGAFGGGPVRPGLAISGRVVASEIVRLWKSGNNIYSCFTYIVDTSRFARDPCAGPC